MDKYNKARPLFWPCGIGAASTRITADDGGDIFALAWGMERVKYMRVSNQKFVEPAERFDPSGVKGGGLPRDS